MDLLDNNILINAFRPDVEHHQVAKTWLEDALNSRHPIRLFPTVEAGFLRVVTKPRIFSTPSSLAEAWSFLEVLCSCPNVETCLWSPSVRTRWGSLCAELGMKGNDCNDSMLAALALEKHLRVVTFDKGFQRFPKLQLLLLTS